MNWLTESTFFKIMNPYDLSANKIRSIDMRNILTTHPGQWSSKISNSPSWARISGITTSTKVNDEYINTVGFEGYVPITLLFFALKEQFKFWKNQVFKYREGDSCYYSFIPMIILETILELLKWICIIVNEFINLSLLIPRLVIAYIHNAS